MNEGDDAGSMAELTEMEVRGLQKAYALLQKGMESQCELMDELKQQTRAQTAEIARLRALCQAHGVDPDRCGNFPGGEQCCLRHGHAGGCVWAGGD